MGKNEFLKKRDARDRAFFAAGMDVGTHMAVDYLQLCLRRPDIVGKDIFGRERIEKLLQGAKKMDLYFQKAFSGDVDADYSQEELDSCLREIWGEDLVPFRQRYKWLLEERYDKPGRKHRG